MGGVTCKDKRDAYLKQFCSITGLDLQTLHKRCFPSTWHLLDKGMISFSKAWNHIKKNIPHLDELPEDFKYAGFEIFEDPQVIGIVKEVKKTHAVGMLSNMSVLLHDRLKKRKFPFPLFSETFLSYKIHMRKPELQIYRHVMKKTGLKGNEILLIDNRQRNLLPAKKMGWKTIHYKNSTQLKKEIKKFLR